MAAKELWLPASAQRSQGQTNFKKANPPKTGEAFGAWAGRTSPYVTMPGGGVLQFDLSRLTLADFRAMKDHYQINASLSILSFMMHQLDWHIECEDQKIADAVEENMRLMWTRLIRGLSQAFWAGYSPMVIDWENNLQSKHIEATKFKDLVPEECMVNWKQVEGYAPPMHAKPKFNVYDGIKQAGSSFPIPAENTLWYPLLMENGDYYGKKLLRSAFTPWFFSILIHLFANRYFERFGEPVPVGRVPFEDDVMVGGQLVNARDAMMDMLEQLRSRAVVVMPSERDHMSNSQSGNNFTWDIEYLESQMRGADFERYLTRLDEEMSIGLFTPILLLRTADVGSYNLGQGHKQTYDLMLNALAGDFKEYVDRFYVWRFVDFNFGPNAPRAFWKPSPLGKASQDTLTAVITSLITKDKVKPDIDELGQALGMSLTEIKEVTADPADDVDPITGKPVAKPEPKKVATKPVKNTATRSTMNEIGARIKQQSEKAFRDQTFGKSFTPQMGYRRRFEESLKAAGLDPQTAHKTTDALYARMDRWLADMVALGTDEFSSSDQFAELFSTMLDTEVDQLAIA